MAGSVRRKLTENANDSKNTRLNIAKSGEEGDWRVDVLAHLSRYNRIAHLAIRESAALRRPLDCLEIGCGEFWPLKVLYKAYQVPKDRVVRSSGGDAHGGARVMEPLRRFGYCVRCRRFLELVLVAPGRYRCDECAGKE